jgi:hypothetical protein
MRRADDLHPLPEAHMTYIILWLLGLPISLILLLFLIGVGR